MILIDSHGQPIDPYAPIGPCAICGDAAWTVSASGLLCPSHTAALEQYREDCAVSEVTKRIVFNRDTKDFDCHITIDGLEDYIGSASTYGQAEILANNYAISYFEDAHTPEKAAALVMANCLSGHVAALTYPAFARFVVGLEQGGDALDLGAQLADELAAHIV